MFNLLLSLDHKWLWVVRHQSKGGYESNCEWLQLNTSETTRDCMCLRVTARNGKWLWARYEWLKLTVIELGKISRFEINIYIVKNENYTTAAIFNVCLTKHFSCCMYNNQFINSFSIAWIVTKSSQRTVTHNSWFTTVIKKLLLYSCPSQIDNRKQSYLKEILTST